MVTLMLMMKPGANLSIMCRIQSLTIRLILLFRLN